MLGARLKSWVEAQLGRARRRKQKSKTAPPPPPPPLSSPESAYSTGYSTDGTLSAPAPAAITPCAAILTQPPRTAPPAPPPPPTTHFYQEPTKSVRRSSCSVAAPRAPPERPPAACSTPSPRPRCRIRTNPWLPSPCARRRAPPLSHPAPAPPSAVCSPPAHHHKPYAQNHHPRPIHAPLPRVTWYKGGASSDEETREKRSRSRETAILSDADLDSEGDTGLDGGDEGEGEEPVYYSPGRRRARRRRPPRRPPRSAGATPPRRRRVQAQQPAPVLPRDPLLEADREAERKYRELIREAERLLVSVTRPLEPPHNPRVRLLRETEPSVCLPSAAVRRSPERNHLTNFMRANTPPPEPPPRRASPARQSPLAVKAAPPQQQFHQAGERPQSEPPKRKTYDRDVVLVETLEGLRRSLQQQSALLAVQRTRLDSL